MRKDVHETIRILSFLSDEKGHANWDIAKYLEEEKGNTKKKIDLRRKDGLIEAGSPRPTTRPESSRPKQLEIPFYISRDIRAFNDIIKMIIKNDYVDLGNKIINSDYIDTLIRSNTFIAVYDAIEKYLEISDFRRRASSGLLTRLATIQEYQRAANLISDYFLGVDLKDVRKYSDNGIKTKSIKYLPLWYTVTDDRNDVWRSKLNKALPPSSLDIRHRLQPIHSKHIEILKRFNSEEAVDLYRKTIYLQLSDLYTELEQRSLITSGISWFMDFDNYLSPFSSFPTNSLSSLLFSRPFKRIYEDVFLLDQEDKMFLVDRARSIYLNFSDFIFDFFRNNLPMKKRVLEQQIRQFIFEWNVASTNFDSILYYLESVYGDERGSGKYHLKSEDMMFQIEDITTNRPLLSNEEFVVQFSSMPIIVTVPGAMEGQGGAEYMDEPYTYLRPCQCFNSIDEMDFIPMEQIMSKLKTRFEEHGFNYDELK